MSRKYTNPEIEKEIQEKGFCVYEYLNKRELFFALYAQYIRIYLQIGNTFLVYLLVFACLLSIVFII